MKRLIGYLFVLAALSLAIFGCGSTTTNNTFVQDNNNDNAIHLEIKEARFVTATSAIVTWETHVRATCVISFGTDQTRLDRSIPGILPVREDSSPSSGSTSSTSRFHYEVFLTGLPANSPIFFRVLAQAPGLFDETSLINQVGGTIINPGPSIPGSTGTDVSVSTDSTAPARSYVVGQVNVEAARITVTNNTNENVRITRVPLVSSVSAPPLINLRLVNLSNQIGLSPSTNLLNFVGNAATFDNLDIIIAAKTTLTLQPRGDISSATTAHGANFTVNLDQTNFTVVNAATGVRLPVSGSVTNGAISVL
jgi:hypothetical protein